MEGLGAAREGLCLGFMPSDPCWALPAVDEEVRKCLEALLHRHTPGLRVLIDLTGAQLVLNVRPYIGTAAGDKARVTRKAHVHEECVITIAQHAKTRPFKHGEPEFKLGVIIVPIDGQTKCLDRTDVFCSAVERGRDHLRRLTLDMSGDRRHAKHAGGRPLDGRVRLRGLAK